MKETVVTNDRWGRGTQCKHGGFFTCGDRFNPGKVVQVTIYDPQKMQSICFAGVLQKHKWENAMTIDKNSWGYRADARFEDFLTIEELIERMMSWTFLLN